MPLPPGTRLGPYEIVSHLGAGGMGDIYKARDTRLDRIVAIKVSAERFGERFESEARAIAALVGTIPYMSPEQLDGREVDARSDVFAFGAVLYEMLTGRRAFQGQSTVSIITAVTRDEPKPVRELVKGVPPELEQIVLRCLR